jgi:cell division control protein 6
VDVLIKKGASDIIYQLSRFNEESINVSSSVSLIMISQEYVLDRLDSASLSTFRRTNAISFDRYKRDELLDIVRARADEALHAGHARDDSLELMADIAAEWGDARFVIEMLERSAMIAEEAGASEVDAEHVREAKAMTYSVVTESKLTELDRQQKLTLLAVARSIKGDAYVNTGQAEKAYVLACEEYGEKARKHTQFWTYIRSLSDQGLLETSVRGDPDGGRTTYISLPDMPAKVLKEKMAQLLQDEA